MSDLKAIAVWLILCLILVGHSIAASPTAEIHLRVADHDLQPLHGAMVVLYRLERVSPEPTSVAHAATDKNGEASFENLPPARYFVRADLTRGKPPEWAEADGACPAERASSTRSRAGVVCRPQPPER